MTLEKRDEECAELTARAFYLLERPQRFEPRDAIADSTSLLRAWHYPAFGIHRSWTVFRSRRHVYTVRRLEWDRPFDMARLLEPMTGLKHGFGTTPSIQARDVELPTSEVDRLLSEATSLTIPVLAEPVGLVGLDGENFGLAWHPDFHGISVQWWCAGPAEWSSIADWAASLRTFLIAHVS